MWRNYSRTSILNVYQFNGALDSMRMFSILGLSGDGEFLQKSTVINIAVTLKPIHHGINSSK
jgi:hypothetical protein